MNPRVKEVKILAKNIFTNGFCKLNRLIISLIIIIANPVIIPKIGLTKIKIRLNGPTITKVPNNLTFLLISSDTGKMILLNEWE